MVYNVLDICRYVINYSNKSDYGISNLKLQKILYFIQASFLTSNKNHNPCFHEKIEAWDFGTVIPVAYHEYMQYGSGDIPTIKSYISLDKNNIWKSKRVKFDDSIIANDDKKRINAVIDMFADYSATDLVALTRKQLPWLKSYSPYENKEITNDLIRGYFDD